MTIKRASRLEDQILVLGRGAGSNLVGQLVGRTMHIVGQILLARWLGPVLFGLYAIGWNMLRFATILLPLGMDIGVIRVGAPKWPGDKQGAGRVALVSTSLTFALGLFAGAGFYFGAPWLASFFGKPTLLPVLHVFALAFPFASGLKVAAYATRITQRMRFGILSEELAQPAINLILIIVLFAIASEIAAAVWAAVLSFACGFALAAFYVQGNFGRNGFPAWDSFKREAGVLLDTSLPIGAATIFATAVLVVDRILVGYFLSEEAAGIYQAISLFSVFFVTILSAFKIIVAPMIAKLYSSGDRKGLQDLFRVSTRWVFYLSLPAAAVILFTAEDAIAVIFGTSYVAGALSLAVLIFAQLANSATGAIEHFLIMTNNQRSWLAISGFTFFINVILNLLLIPLLGLPGAAIATLATFSLMSILALIQVKRRVHIWPYDRNYLKGAVATFVMVAVLWALTNLHIGAPILEIGVMGAAAYVVFAAILVLLGLEAEDKQIFSMVASRIGRDTK